MKSRGGPGAGGGAGGAEGTLSVFTLLDLCVSSLRRRHANLLCIVPMLTDDPRRESRAPRAFLFQRHCYHLYPQAHNRSVVSQLLVFVHM